MANTRPTGEKTYIYVFNYFSDKILSGELRLNDKIETEREIAEKLGVSRNSVREVMHMLEISGLIECVQGSGNYVRCDSTDYMVKSAKMIISLMGIKFDEIFHLRNAFEIAALKLAMESITDSELNRMKEILTKMDENLSAKESAKYDAMFHDILVRSSHSQLLILYYSMIGNLTDSFVENFRTMILRNKLRAEMLRRSHWDIYKALENKEIDQGLKAMDKHFRLIAEQIQKITKEN